MDIIFFIIIYNSFKLLFFSPVSFLLRYLSRPTMFVHRTLNHATLKAVQRCYTSEHLNNLLATFRQLFTHYITVASDPLIISYKTMISC